MNAKQKKKPMPFCRRDEVPDTDNLCEYCNAKCCRYFALPIDMPENYQEFDFVRWYLLHEKAAVFVEDKTWYLVVHTKCKNLQDDNRCGIYETRPQICKEYSTKKCEFDDNFLYDQYFDLPDQVEEYAQAILGPRPGATFRTNPKERR